MTLAWTLSDRLHRMAVSHARVTDPRSVAGTIHIDLDHAAYVRDPDAAHRGLLDLFIGTGPGGTDHRNNITVALTRFIVDSTVDVNDLLDHAFADLRRLTDWTETRADRYPIDNRTRGGSVQAGHYAGTTGDRRFLVHKHVIYQRANVVYLLQCSGTTASDSAVARSTLSDAVVSTRLDD
ncbi:LpqN/LpqT family lipoprotein [Gordonia sp. 'Campus']|uniref:LpqN/LpqT family lipoprotein n=1 Tax=Gordonia sp. 'Campus' TaxID=2915824 RepID=UPI001EE3D1BB|nr:LpqN/LpqT family lipoprotein [Gordonia sp. 'Campus']